MLNKCGKILGSNKLNYTLLNYLIIQREIKELKLLTICILRHNFKIEGNQLNFQGFILNK